MNWSDAEKRKAASGRTLDRLRGFRLAMDDTFMEGSLRKIFRWQSWCFGSLPESLI